MQRLCFLADSISSRGIFAFLLFECVTEVSVNAMTLNFVQKVLRFSVWAGGRQLSCSIGHMTVVGQTAKFQRQSPGVRKTFCVPLSLLYFCQFYNRGTVTSKPEIHFDLTFLLKIVRMPNVTITLFGFSNGYVTRRGGEGCAERHQKGNDCQGRCNKVQRPKVNFAEQTETGKP